MLSSEELAYLTWLGAAAWTGQGEVLEIGPWLGGSSYALARGLHGSPHTRPGALTCVDSFIWKNFMGDRSGLNLKDGDSFLPQFQKNLAEFGALVRTVKAQLPDEPIPGDPDADIRSTDVTEENLFHWSRDRTLEILFIDGAKSYSGLKHLLIETAETLVPGRSLLVFQDYKYWGAYWVPWRVELLGERLQVAHVLRHNTVSFLVTTPPDRTFLEKLPALESLDWQEGQGLLRQAAARMDGLGDAEAAAILRAALVRFLAHKGRLQESEQAFRSAEAQWPAMSPVHNLEKCRGWLQTRLGKPLPASWPQRTRRLTGALLRKFRKR